jgi:hypothetical protein
LGTNNLGISSKRNAIRKIDASSISKDWANFMTKSRELHSTLYLRPKIPIKDPPIIKLKTINVTGLKGTLGVTVPT